MYLKYTKIFLYVVIVLTICQYSQSQNYGNYEYDDNGLYEAIDVSDKKDVICIQTINDNLTRIAGGEYAELGQYPYMVVVHQLFGNGRIGQCGGTILSDRWVLTAGHCVVNQPQKFFLVFGLIDKSGIGYDFNQGKGISMISTDARLHPGYNSYSMNDIALIRTPKSIPFSSTIQPIKLFNHNDDLENTNAYVIGWGKDKLTSQGTKNLKYAMLPIIGNNKCKQYWDISSKHVCTAPGLGKDACQGDSGGPLVIVNNGEDYQIGIVSYGNARCPSDMPGVFTRVSSFLDWIQNNINI